MFDPRELTNAEVNAVCGGQANIIATSQTATATPTSADADASVAAIPPGTVRITTNTFLGPAGSRAATSIFASQSGS